MKNEIFLAFILFFWLQKIKNQIFSSNDILAKHFFVIAYEIKFQMIDINLLSLYLIRYNLDKLCSIKNRNCQRWIIHTYSCINNWINISPHLSLPLQAFQILRSIAKAKQTIKVNAFSTQVIFLRFFATFFKTKTTFTKTFHCQEI